MGRGIKNFKVLTPAVYQEIQVENEQAKHFFLAIEKEESCLEIMCVCFVDEDERRGSSTGFPRK